MEDINLVQMTKSLEDYFYHKFGIVFLFLNLFALAIQLAEENKAFVNYEGNIFYVYLYSHFGFLSTSIIWFVLCAFVFSLLYFTIIMLPHEKDKLLRFLLKKMSKYRLFLISKYKLFFYIQFAFFIFQLTLILWNTILFGLLFGF